MILDSGLLVFGPPCIYRSMITFVSVALSYAELVSGRRPRNWSDIPMTGYIQVSAQKQAYLDWTTQFILYIYIYQCSGVSANHDKPAGNPHKKREANPGADHKNIQKIYNIHVRSTRPLIVRIYTLRLAPLYTGFSVYRRPGKQGLSQ